MRRHPNKKHEWSILSSDSNNTCRCCLLSKVVWFSMRRVQQFEWYEVEDNKKRTSLVDPGCIVSEIEALALEVEKRVEANQR